MHKIPLSAFVVRLREAGILTIWDGDPDTIIEDIQYDSRKIGPHSLFLCKGAHFDPSYITKAKEAGAVAYLAVRPFEEGEDLQALIVSDIRKALAICADVFFESPWKKLKMIGVTGTKGKSTTVTLLKAMLDEQAALTGGPKAGITSSVRVYDGLEDIPAVLTTPENVDLYRYLDNAVGSGLTTMIVEVSSQALKYHRVGCIRFDRGVFTNISPDHISDIEHPDFADYFSSKCMLFSVCHHAYINKCSDHFSELEQASSVCRDTTVFAAGQQADIYAKDVTPLEDGIDFNLCTSEGEYPIHLAMKGSFNVENAVAAAAVALDEGVSVECIQSVLARSHFAGHMVYRYSDDGLTVIVDFAHNLISFQSVFRAVHDEFGQVPIICVFGCAGSKAQSRRKDLGQFVDTAADRVYLVPDDPAHERVADINQEIIDEFKVQKQYASLAHREDGICDAIMSAPANAVVLVLGKGGEVTQKGPDGPLPYDGDVPLSEKYIAKRNQEGVRPSLYF
jgi:UDP-N-acetylmuramyl-tripeptide synthetase